VSLAPAPEGAAGLAGGSTVPRHVAIIMDGNGRWAKQRGLPRVAGHRAGAEAVRRALQAAADRGVAVLTLYAFSSENWRRSEEEISDLTALMRFYLERELKTLQKERVRLKLIGDYSAFGRDLVERLEQAVERTARNDRLTLVIALNYGEVRLSNFLLWQAAYAELLFLDVLWPDFDEAAFAEALETYAGRQRRFGGR